MFHFLEPQREQQLRRRLQKSHLKSEFMLLQTLSRLFHFVQFHKLWRIFLEINSKGLYQSSGKGKENRFLMFTSHTKRETRPFHVVSRATTAKKCTKKRDARANVMHVQSCLANLNLLFFCSRRRCLSSLSLVLRTIAHKLRGDHGH